MTKRQIRRLIRCEIAKSAYPEVTLHYEPQMALPESSFADQLRKHAVDIAAFLRPGA